MAIDVFCAPDDQHRVVPLVDLMRRAGQAVNLHSEPAATMSRPRALICTRRALRLQWAASLFEDGEALIAICLDDAPLPGRCARVVDMQSWPARSADRHVGSLVRWLQGGTGTAATGDAARSSRAGVAGASPDVEPVRRQRNRVRQAAPRPRSARAAVVVVLLLLAAGLWVWLAARGPAAPQPADTAPLQSVAETAMRNDAAVDVVGTPVLEDSANDPLAPPAAPGTDSVGGSSGDSAAVSSKSAASIDSGPDAALPAEAPVDQRDDAIARLCRARTPAAARAWAGVLDWKQRARLPTEPCVRELLRRPGFASLAATLDLS